MTLKHPVNHKDHTVTFEPHNFEVKWQRQWEESSIYRADNAPGKPSCFVVDMFPYPSGSSMHVGHPRGYVGTDVYSRFKRMNGYNILHPMGWDAFGLPAEETAIENKEYPAETVERNIKKFKAQLIMLGLGYDWSREINTTDPAYYGHTQRIFLEFFRRGLAKNNTIAVNWCPKLGTVLANEDIVDGKSERGGHPVFQQPMRQWILTITKYADRLVDDLELLPQWPEKVKNAQRSWIGRSEGHEFTFTTTVNIDIPIFTTRLETLPGVTFLVLAPESELTRKFTACAANQDQLESYATLCSQITELDRQISHRKTGVVIDGITAYNSITGEQIPIIVADYVLASYGTGAIMAVPAHDKRDGEIAKVLGLSERCVIDTDVMMNAGRFNGKQIHHARADIAAAILATPQKSYKIRDWVFSRQRFWGEPFPIVWIKGKANYALLAAGAVAEWLPQEAVSYVEDGEEYFALPILPKYLDSMRLPTVDSYLPTGSLEGPLAGIEQWVNAFIDPLTGEIANTRLGPGWIAVRRDTNTMPQWAGSSWYWLRYMDPNNEAMPFSKEAARLWGPVDVYAGADHAVAHLIYARFWHKVMQDAGMVDFSEPFVRLEFLGHILAADGAKISKRKGNSRSPEDVVREVGADTFRLYEMFIGPFEKPIPWSDNGLTGCRRFLEKVWNLAYRVMDKRAAQSDPAALEAIHHAIHKVGDDIEAFRFNTAVSSMMICLNEIQQRTIVVDDLLLYIALLAPFAPHMTEEIWSATGHNSSIHVSKWPVASHSLLRKKSMTLPIQINGRVRSQINVASDVGEEALKQLALGDKKVIKYLEGNSIRKFIYISGRIINLVT